jgi:hypothetical protein
MPHSLLNRTEPGSAARHPPGSWQTQKIPSPKGRDHEVPRYHPCSPTSARGTRVSLTHSVRRTALLTVGDSVGAYLAATPVVDRWTKHFGPRLGRDVRQGVSRLLSPSGPHWRTGQTRCAIVPRYSSPSRPLHSSTLKRLVEATMVVKELGSHQDRCASGQPVAGAGLNP